MKRMKQLGAAIAFAALLASPEGFALNLLTMRNMPIRHMTDEDREILKTAVIGTLDQGKDGTTVSWENPKTGAHGNLTPKVSFEREAKVCRDLEVANSARGRDNRAVFTLCKQPDGDWKVESQ